MRLFLNFLLGLVAIILLPSLGAVKVVVGLGILFGILGDILMMQKSQTYKTIGGISFWLGHLGYLAALVSLDTPVTMFHILGLAFVVMVTHVMISLIMIAISKTPHYIPRVLQFLTWNMYLYTVGLCFSVALLGPVSWVLFLGFELFLVSDFFVYRNTVHGEKKKLDNIGLALYYAAQFLILIGFGLTV